MTVDGGQRRKKDGSLGREEGDSEVWHASKQYGIHGSPNCNEACFFLGWITLLGRSVS